MQVALVAIGAALLVVGPREASAGQYASGTLTLNDCLVTLIDEVEIPADLPSTEGGRLVAIDAEEGWDVGPGDVVARIDDQEAQMRLKVAQAQLDAALKEVENDVAVRYAQAAAGVAEQEYLQALEACEKHPNSVTVAERRRLLLAHRQALLQIEQAKHDMEIARERVKIREAELDRAQMEIDRRRIKAPIAGVVVKRHVHAGEWVRPGDPILRVVQMNPIRVEGFVDAQLYSPGDVDRKAVDVVIELPGGRRAKLEGKIVFASPIIEAGPRFLVRAEISNLPDRGHWRLRPGQVVDLTIHLDQQVSMRE
jgi:macrolide-specific efflux system membrane fusion protein